MQICGETESTEAETVRRPLAIVASAKEQKVALAVLEARRTGNQCRALAHDAARLDELQRLVGVQRALQNAFDRQLGARDHATARRQLRVRFDRRSDDDRRGSAHQVAVGRHDVSDRFDRGGEGNESQRQKQRMRFAHNFLRVFRETTR